MIVEIFISLIVHYIFFINNKKLKNIVINFLVLLCFLLLLFLTHFIIDFEVFPFVCPISFLVILNPYRFLYKKITKKELNLILRGCYREDYTPADSLFSLILFAIPILIILFIGLYLK